VKIKIDRYLRYNIARIRQAERFDRQRADFLFRIVPLLLHVNHPSLPGYQGDDCPAGIHRFVPSRVVSPALARTWLGQVPADDDLPTPKSAAIHSLKTIGSIGTIAQSAKSDCDYWVSISRRQLGDRIDILAAKCRAIEEWAAGLDHEIHFFLMDIDETRANHFISDSSGESAGSALKLLLKDELFRTHILVAGKMPLWWLVPPGLSSAEHAEQARRLLDAAPALADNCIDLGTIGDIPRNEIFGACLWQFNKALASPFKSVIKFAYLELLLQATRLPLFSDRIKCLVTFPERLASYEQQPLPLEEIDPYLLLAADIVRYYQRQEDRDREDLVRTCLFLKTREGVRSRRVATTPLGRSILDRMAKWHLLPADYEKLLSLGDWPFADLVRLGSRIHAFLSDTYKNLSDMLPEMTGGTAISERDFVVLGRKLIAFYQQRPNKIPYLKTMSREITAQEAVTIHIDGHSGKWQFLAFQGELEQQAVATAKEKLIHRATDIIDLVAWLVVNGVVVPDTRLYLTRTPHPVSLADIEGLAVALRDHMPLVDFSTLPASDLLQDARILQALVVVNMEKVPVQSSRRLPTAIVSCNSHGEYFVHHYETVAQLKQATGDLLTRHYVSRWNGNLHYYIPPQPKKASLTALLGI